ncbi:hypothetical protein OHA72_37000 [Dactylosporangium sp. NBC_01737]|uniref:hypothetical protein n=1 Tax=Dactylosporangium sp. NBC_01737 TaxID=2975959 RepID=UPI002E0FC594|nr:hypothetical protein OHA72_37000 [Dactylosporangium sp. NBC_01737]
MGSALTRTDRLVTFEAAAMYVCATSYRRTARERLPANVVDAVDTVDSFATGAGAGGLIAEFTQLAPARLLKALLEQAADGAVWVESSGYGVRRRLGRHRVLIAPARQTRMLAGLREAWRVGVEAVNDAGPARAVAQATELWRGLLAAGAPVRTGRGLCLPLPAGPLAEVALHGARHLGISARVRHTAQFSVVTVDNQVHVLQLMRIMPYRNGHAPTDSEEPRR